MPVLSRDSLAACDGTGARGGVEHGRPAVRGMAHGHDPAVRRRAPAPAVGRRRDLAGRLAAAAAAPAALRAHARTGSSTGAGHGWAQPERLPLAPGVGPARGPRAEEQPAPLTPRRLRTGPRP